MNPIVYEVVLYLAGGTHDVGLGFSRPLAGLVLLVIFPLLFMAGVKLLIKLGGG